MQESMQSDKESFMVAIYEFDEIDSKAEDNVKKDKVFAKYKLWLTPIIEMKNKI